jgi:hypothetical protein
MEVYGDLKQQVQPIAGSTVKSQVKASNAK